MLWNVQEANGLPITIRGKRPLALYSAKFLPGERNEAGPSNKRWEQTKEDLLCPQHTQDLLGSIRKVTQQQT